MSKETTKTRLDKWLWATRWFKTRSLATTAIKAGRVHVNSRSVKPAHSVAIDDLITITQGPYRRELQVLLLSDKRGPATTAITLYAETADSLSRNERIRAELKAQPQLAYTGSGRPTKRARRAIIRFTDNQN